MSTRATQNPLGINVLGGMLTGSGLAINPIAAGYMGSSTAISNYTYGTVVSSTVLKTLTDAIRQGWVRYNAGELTLTTYTNLLAIGSTTIPALGNSPPSTFNYTGSPSWSGTGYVGQTASYGYVRLFSWQAYNEFNYNSTYATSASYIDFIASMMEARGFIDNTNRIIIATKNSQTFLNGTYSNMNDLITGDIAGISLATTLFGQDLINTGKAINLQHIDTFGLPSNLLQTCKKYNCLTQSLVLALLATGLTNTEVETLIANNNPAKELQQKAYAALLIITGVDLAGILIPLNCNTKGLTTLADLLNIQTLFPTSYQSLTVPIYNTTSTPTNSKTYYPIFIGTGVNSSLSSPSIASIIKFGDYAFNVVPDDIAVSSGAFSVTMQQVKNISQIPIEKFAQVVANLETTRDLNINGSTVPVNTTMATAVTSAIALGSGPYNTYTYSDFFGCMSGLPYTWKQIQQLLLNTQTTTLQSIYTQLLYVLTNSAAGSVNADAQAQIDLANAEILSIYNGASMNVTTLNTLWSNTGTLLSNEQRARNTGLTPLPSPRDATINPYPATQFNFVDTIPAMALETEPNMAAQTLEAISNLTTVPGESIVGLARESRNQARMNLVGIPLDNTIPSTLSVQEQKQLIANGTLAGSFPAVLQQQNPTTLQVIQPEVQGYYDTVTQQYVTTNGPVPTGAPVVPGSLGGSPFSNIIVPELNTLYTSDTLTPASYPVDQAIEQVTLCNCDCWTQ